MILSKGVLSIEKFNPGTIFNQVKLKSVQKVQHKEVEVTVPSRLNAMCFDTGLLAMPHRPHIYTAG